MASFNSKEFRLYPINVQLFEVFEEESGKIKFIFQNRTLVVRKKGGTEISETTNNKEDIGVVWKKDQISGFLGFLVLNFWPQHFYVYIYVCISIYLY